MEIRVLPSKSASHLTFSPTTYEIAFTHFGNNGSGISLINADGTGLRKIFSAGGSNPVWAPDGKMLAYWGLGMRAGLCQLDSETGEHIVTFPIDYVQHMKWSPDGRYIAFMGERENSTGKLYVQDQYHMTYFPINGRAGDYSNFSWTPDSRSFSATFTSGSELDHTQIFRTDIHSGQVWMNPGKQAVISSMGHVATVTNGGIQVKLTSTKRYELEAMNVSWLSWSQDGTRLFFIGEVWNDQGFFSVELGSRKPRLQLSNAENNIVSPTVSFDGQLLAFVQRQELSHPICVLSLDYSE